MHRPERRNRNVGRLAGGRVRDGRGVEKVDRVDRLALWRALSEGSGPRRHVVEHPSRAFVHPASIEEHEAVLRRLPHAIERRVRAIVLRRPRRDEQRRAVEAWRRHAVVGIVAMPADRTYAWPEPPTDAMRRHHAPWCTRWRVTAEGTTLEFTEDEARRYATDHLLLHEVGHVVDDRHRRPSAREAFAEDFALTWARRLGLIED